MRSITMTRRHAVLACWISSVAAVALALSFAFYPGTEAQGQYRVEETSIAAIQSAIQSGQTSCQTVVRAYIERAKAYNGTCTRIITKDGAPIAPATGTVRAGAALTFPTQTVAVSSIYPNFSEY